MRKQEELKVWQVKEDHQEEEGDHHQEDKEDHHQVKVVHQPEAHHQVKVAHQAVVHQDKVHQAKVLLQAWDKAHHQEWDKAHLQVKLDHLQAEPIHSESDWVFIK